MIESIVYKVQQLNNAFAALRCMNLLILLAKGNINHEGSRGHLPCHLQKTRSIFFHGTWNGDVIAPVKQTDGVKYHFLI